MELNGSLDPVVLEPIVNREKLYELLSLEAEYAMLDFKASSKLSETRDKVELAKDIGAMSVLGGYLVVGVDGLGKPIGSPTLADALLFDEARLRPAMLKWLPDSLKLLSQTHEIDGNIIVLIFVEPNPSGCAFFRADGQYQTPGKKDSTTVFRKGEVFFRSGTESTRLTQEGLELVIAQQVRRARESWQEQSNADFERLATGLRSGLAGQRVSAGPASEFSFALEAGVFIDAAVELLRAHDDIPIRRLLGRAASDARLPYRAGDEPALGQILDRLTCLAALFLELERPQWFHRAIDALVAVYSIGFENEPEIINNPPPAAASLWLAIARRVEALGGLAVRRADWSSVAYIAGQKAPGMHRIYATWFKHATTMANRAEAAVNAGNERQPISIVSLARETIRQLECVRPDLEAGDERILASLTQFDFLVCMVAIAQTDATEAAGVFYPHFATFHGTRTQPIAERLIGDHALRQQVYPHDDEHLSQALTLLDRYARQVGSNYDGWEGYPQPVNDFIARHTPPGTIALPGESLCRSMREQQPPPAPFMVTIRARVLPDTTVEVGGSVAIVVTRASMILHRRRHHHQGPIASASSAQG